MIQKLVDIFSGNIGSPENKGVDKVKASLYADRPGKIVISNRSNDKSSAIIVSDDSVKITDGGTTTGISVLKGGVVIQGSHTFTSSGVNIRKGEYSENPRSNRIFTYRETVLPESVPTELASEVAGYTDGANISSGMDGVFPIMTDFAPGPVPHFHTISMKHVHRVDPAYLYRIPPAVNFIAGAIKVLSQFSKA